ncbi:methyltransferase domain-containing protein [Geopyxis carbonaria]|nr:methyltransferase domain-containing protein [Geopyxis carbonaria]
MDCVAEAPVCASPNDEQPPKQSKPDGPKQSDPFQFGSRFLLPEDDPMQFNAWDHVEVDDEYKEYARSQIEKQRSQPVSEFDKARFMNDPSKWWDTFYKNNGENFFKDRKWLQQEFPALVEATTEGAGPRRVVELGCGAGNTLFPVLKQNLNREFHIHGCDFSAQAVSLVKSHPIYLENHPEGNVSASVYDLGLPDTLPEGIEPDSVDIVVMVFVFSALAPEQWVAALGNIRRMLKKGGKCLLRDYGRNDLAQVRFRGSRYLEENFYVRGDGTRVYFFEESELEQIFTGKVLHDQLVNADVAGGYGGFTVNKLAVDKRMLVNRKRQIKMYRRWVQAIFEKI